MGAAPLKAGEASALCGAWERRGLTKKCQDFIFSDGILLENKTQARRTALFSARGRAYLLLWFYAWYIYTWPGH